MASLESMDSCKPSTQPEFRESGNVSDQRPLWLFPQSLSVYEISVSELCLLGYLDLTLNLNVDLVCLLRALRRAFSACCRRCRPGMDRTRYRTPHQLRHRPVLGMRLPAVPRRDAASALTQPNVHVVNLIPACAQSARARVPLADGASRRCRLQRSPVVPPAHCSRHRR